MLGYHAPSTRQCLGHLAAKLRAAFFVGDALGLAQALKRGFRIGQAVAVSTGGGTAHGIGGRLRLA